MQLATLNDLFVHELKDVYDAEHQLVEALPRLAEAATNPELARAFRNHLEETRGHVTRLEGIFRELGASPERETCKGMRGLIAEGEKLIREIDEPDLLDAALISAAQRVEHYEISAYGTLRVWAGTAGLAGVTEDLEAILDEEKAADGTLTEIAESEVNLEAEDTAGEDEEEDARARAPHAVAAPRSRATGSGNKRRANGRTRKSARGRRTTTKTR